jgi:hypothetical protein
MGNEFLHKEYELCFQQFRYYDDRQNNLIKYLVTLTSSIATAVFAIYKFLEAPTQQFFICQTFLSAVVFVASVLIYLSMLQNRLYFVFIARQLNAIRGFLLREEAAEFKNNQLYTSTDFSATKRSSIHTYQLLGASILSGFFAGTFTYSMSPALNLEPCWWLAAAVFVLISGAEITGGFKYLSSCGSKPADEAIHQI